MSLVSLVRADVWPKYVYYCDLPQKPCGDTNADGWLGAGAADSRRVTRIPTMTS